MIGVRGAVGKHVNLYMHDVNGTGGTIVGIVTAVDEIGIEINKPGHKLGTYMCQWVPWARVREIHYEGERPR